ncbi:hypothetical protein LCGC14_0063050 [marine sediment metagenome]
MNLISARALRGIKPDMSKSIEPDTLSGKARLLWVGLTMGLLLAGCAGDDKARQVEAEQDFRAVPASIAAGQTTQLSWTLDEAQSISIGGLTATPQSSVTVAPVKTTTYRLTASDANGKPITREVTVNVAADSILAKVDIDPAQAGRELPSGFLGLSHEWGQAQLMMGDPQIGTNPIYRQLLANLTERSGGPISLRIGGSTTGRTSTPTTNTVSPLAQVYRDMADSTPGVSFILGVNMGAGVPGLAARQAKTFVEEVPQGSIQAIELGNQPDFFVAHDYRADNYSFEDYMAEFRFYAQHIREAIPAGPPFAGPSMAGFAGVAPVPLVPETDFGTPLDLERLLTQEHQTIGIVSQHAYAGAGEACGGDVQSGFLLEPRAATAGPEEIERYIDVANRMGKPYRITEMNSIMCSGQPGVSDAFEAALWAPDILFEYAYRGVAGVNLHSNIWNTVNGWDLYSAFLFDVPAQQYQASQTEAPPPPGTAFPGDYELRKVLPLYYGMLFFAEATANQAELLPVAVATDANLKAWATRNPETGRITVALINKDRTASGPVHLSIPGYTSGRVKRMLAPSFRATEGISLGGQTFDQSKYGQPLGTEYAETVSSSTGQFEVALGATSALLLSLDR